jgi:hypothetical protein
MTSWTPLSLLLAAVLTQVQALPGYPAPTAPPRLRPVGPRAIALISIAARRSPTVRAQLGAIDRSDLVVYLAVEPSFRDRLASTTLLGAGRGCRFVRVWINSVQRRPDQLAMIGHELAHVLEIAATPEVTDQQSLLRLYRIIGDDRARFNRFETTGAREAEENVRRELVSHRTRAE